MLHVLTKDGQKLFSGSRHDVKLWIRKNNVKNYVIKERFTEKVAEIKEDVPINPTYEYNEGFFNKVFNTEDDND